MKGQGFYLKTDIFGPENKVLRRPGQITKACPLGNAFLAIKILSLD